MCVLWRSGYCEWATGVGISLPLIGAKTERQVGECPLETLSQEWVLYEFALTKVQRSRHLLSGVTRRRVGTCSES